MQYPNSGWSPTVATNSRQRYGSVPRQYGHRRVGPTAKPTRSGPPVLLSPETSDDDGTIDLRDTADRLQVTTELPDCSREDIRVSKVGATLRIRADSSGETDGTDETGESIDRTITLGDALAGSPMDVTYDGDTLRVSIPKPNRRW